jgi:hypothetical protein
MALPVVLVNVVPAMAVATSRWGLPCLSSVKLGGHDHPRRVLIRNTEPFDELRKIGPAAGEPGSNSSSCDRSDVLESRTGGDGECSKRDSEAGETGDQGSTYDSDGESQDTSCGYLPYDLRGGV